MSIFTYSDTEPKSNDVRRRRSFSADSCGGLTSFERTENGDDKDGVPDEEIDSGIQSEKGRTLKDESSNAIEDFARASAQDLIEETARDFAKARRNSGTDSGASPTGNDDGDRDSKASSDHENFDDDKNLEEMATIGDVSGRESPPSEDAVDDEDILTGSDEERRTDDLDISAGTCAEEVEKLSDSDLDTTREVSEEEPLGIQDAGADEQKNFGGEEAGQDSDGAVEEETEEEADGPPDIDERPPDTRDRGDEESSDQPQVEERKTGLKDIIKKVLAEEQINLAEDVAKSSRPPLTPQNSLVVDADSTTENYERTLSAIPESASPNANSEIQDDGECRWHDGMTLD